MYSYKLFLLLVLVVLLQEGDAKHKKKNYKRSVSNSSDESSSKPSAPNCPGMFQCKNLTCIDIAKVCDSEMNCGENEDELNCPEQCPRVCAYQDFNCFTQFDVPTANQLDVFIDINGFEILSGSADAVCQAACSANTDCKTAIIEVDFSSFPEEIKTTCFLSKMTVTELEDNTNITVVVNSDCNTFDQPITYFVFEVNNCV